MGALMSSARNARARGSSAPPSYPPPAYSADVTRLNPQEKAVARTQRVAAGVSEANGGGGRSPPIRA